MRLAKYRKAAAGFTSLALALAGLTFLPARAKAQRQAGEAVMLRPGLLVHPIQNVGYVMTPEGVAEVDLATGAKRWTTSDAAKPLALAGTLLVSQAERRTVTNLLEVVALRTQERGAAAVRGARELPRGVRVSVGETLEGKFEVEARPSAGVVDLFWNFEPTPIRGIGDPEDEEPAEVRLSRLRRARGKPANAGAFRMSLATGAMTPLAGAQLLKPPLSVRLSADMKEPGAPKAQYESADGRHLLLSERVADDRVWEKYRWTVTERASGRRVGEIRTHVSFATFVVRGPVLIYETTPFVRRGSPPEPAKLRGVSLGSGQQVWEVEVRENVYRGPFPP